MHSRKSKNPAKGEVSGAFLLGLMESFLSQNVLPRSTSLLEPHTIDAAGWYPYALVIETLNEIAETLPSASAILFRAGVHFIRLWYHHGPGKTMIHSGRDWLYANRASEGYYSVVRGGSREEIGWCVIQDIDEEAGIVTYENVMPLAPDYVRGVFYGGCHLFDDMDYVNVSVNSGDFAPNPDFIRTLVTVRFRLKPKVDAGDLEQQTTRATQGEHVSLSPEAVQRLIWRYESMKVRRELDSRYFDDLSAVLVSTNEKNLRLARELSGKVEALQGALDRVRTLEGLLPICAWCKRMREDDTTWVPAERYFAARTAASFTHVLCPECAEKMK